MMQLIQNVCCQQSIQATAEIEQFLLVGLDGGVCKSGKIALGVAETSASFGDMVAVNVLGIAIVLTGAAITAGAVLQSDDDGAAIPQGAAVSGVTPAAVGIALDAAAGAGEAVRILRGV